MPQDHEANDKPPIVAIDLDWDGDPRDLNFIFALRNVGQGHACVDEQLVFLVDVELWTPEGRPIEFETMRRLARPSNKRVRERIVRLEPGEVLKRKVRLRDGFKRFTWDWTHGDPDSVASAEEICRVPEGSSVGKVSVTYATPGWNATHVTYALAGGRFLDYEPKPVSTLNYGLPPELSGRLLLAAGTLFIQSRIPEQSAPAETAEP